MAKRGVRKWVVCMVCGAEVHVLVEDGEVKERCPECLASECGYA